MELIYILLPVHNRVEITKDLVRCLEKQSYRNFSIILIDDGSIDGTKEEIAKLIKLDMVIVGTGNWWWAGSLQKGIDYLKGIALKSSDIVLILNNDLIVESDFLRNAIDILEKHEQTLLLPQYIDTKTGDIKETGICADLKKLSFKVAHTKDEINCLSTRGLFLRWSDMQEIGDFHPTLLPHYGSDYEYTIRAYRKGFRLYTTPELTLIPKLDITGYKDFDNLKISELTGVLLSKKSVKNPLYQTVLAIYVSPWRYLPTNIMRVWYRVVAVVIRTIYRRCLE